MEVKKQRAVSYELLRIIAMLMIVILHYLSKGGVLRDLSGNAPFTGADYAAWFVEALCMGCVNAYIMISGYHGCMQEEFRIRKLFRLWETTLFYSIAITLLCGVCGVLMLQGQATQLSGLNLYDWLAVLFPVTTQEYWYITVYLIASLFIPFVNQGIRKLPKRTFQWILGMAILLLSVAKSVLPMEVPYDGYGYDVAWFLCVYLLGAYIRLYGFPLVGKKWRSLLLYLASATATFGIGMLVRALYVSSGALATYVTRNPFYQHNFILNLVTAVGLFCFFASIHIKEGLWAKGILLVSSCTLGVYLIHEQFYFRYMWTSWCGASQVAGTWAFLPHMLLTVLVIFAACTLIEYVRSRIARLLFRPKEKSHEA